MTDDAELIARLRARKAFGLNGATWMMLSEPDVDCQAAADALARRSAPLPADVAGLVDRIRKYGWENGERDCVTAGDLIASQAREIERLTAELIPGSPTERHPTTSAYEQACQVARQHLKRAEAAEARVRELDNTIDKADDHTAMLLGEIDRLKSAHSDAIHSHITMYTELKHAGENSIANVVKELSKVRTERDDFKVEREAAEAGVTALARELAQTRAWVNDLQSGMYVNCVYCGHQYGPGDTTPVSMADALKAHVEQCQQHPMSALKQRAEAAEARVRELDKTWALACAMQAERTAIRAALDELANAAERDMKMNQGGDDHEDEPESSGGWWSTRTADAIAKARALAKETAA